MAAPPRAAGSGGRTVAVEPLLAGALAFALFVAAGEVPLIGRDEGRFAQAAREMAERRDAVVPTFAGEGRYHKPILHYWCTMASYAVFGVNPRSARLPSNLAAALTVAVVAAAARRRWGAGWGVTAALLLAATPVFHVQARAATADMVNLLPITVALLALRRLDEGPDSPRAAVVFWAAMALAVLAKGPVGPMVALSCLLALWALRRSWSRREALLLAAVLGVGGALLGPPVLAVPVLWAVVDRLRRGPWSPALGRLRPARGLVLLAVIVLPWLAAVTAATDGAFLREAVGRHVVQRSMSSLESHGGFPGFYLATAVIACLPWFAALPQSLCEGWVRLRSQGETAFLLAWLLGPLLVLELVRTKLVHYWMPSYPAAVLLVVGWLAARSEPPPRLGLPWRGLLLAGALAAAAAPAAVAVRLELEEAVAAGVVTGLPLAVLGLLGASFVASRPRAALSAAAIGSLSLVLLLATVFLPALADHLLPTRAARRALELRAPGETLVVYRVRDDELFFNLPLDAAGCRSEDGLAARLRAGEPLLGIARQSDLDRFREAHPGLAVGEVAAVDGVDLGRVSWQRIVLFRGPEGAR